MKLQKNNSFTPDKKGFYGEYGGRYAPELLVTALEELESVFYKAKKDRSFVKELYHYYKTFVGRPTPLFFCERLTKEVGGAKIFVKNEGLAHTGAHKINHCVGQALLAKRMKKRRLIADTGAGQHGVATSAVAAKFGFSCTIFMGAVDVARQRPNVFWMNQLGAEVRPVEFGKQRLKDAVNAAMKEWMARVNDTHFLLGSCVGPHPYPEINRFFQKVVGEEIRSQFIEETGKLPDYVIACVGGGSNAIGAFDVFLEDDKVSLIGVEAGGLGKKLGMHATRFNGGKTGIAEGYKTIWLQNEEGQIAPTQSISAGLDYAGVGPLHAYLKDAGRVEYTSATDKEVLTAFKMLAQCEGILAALESSHAVATAIKLAAKLPKQKSIVINVSGRAEKDLFLLATHTKDKEFFKFLKSVSENE
jgi:tryptophan synthase beta chain